MYKNENKLMLKFGLTIDMCDNDDWREIFDIIPGTVRHTKVVNKYITEVRRDAFMRELYNYQMKINSCYNIIGALKDKIDNYSYEELLEVLREAELA